MIDLTEPRLQYAELNSSWHKSKLKYLVNIGQDRLFFDACRRRTRRHAADQINDPRVPLAIWPVDEEPASSTAWDRALAWYSMEERRAAKIRVLR